MATAGRLPAVLSKGFVSIVITYREGRNASPHNKPAMILAV